MHCTLCTDQGRFPYNPKFGWYIKWNGPFQFGPPGICTTSFAGGPLWPVLLSWSVRPKCPFPFDKIVVPSTTLLHPAYKNNNQTHGGLGWVCATGMYRSIGHVEFPKCQTGIFVEWKAPQGYHLPPIYETICSLVKTRLQITANITDGFQKLRVTFKSLWVLKNICFLYCIRIS